MPGGILGFTPSGVPYGGGVGLTLVPAAELPQVVAQLEASTINPGPFASAVDFVETIAKGIAAGAAGAALGYVAVTAASAAVTAAEGVGTVAAADATAGLAATEAAAAEVAAASALTAAPSASLPAVVTSTLQRLATSLTSSYLAQALRPKPAAPAAPQVFLLAPSGGRIMDDYDYIPDASGAFDLPSIDWRQLSDSALQVLVNRNANQSSGPTAQLVIPSLPGGMQQTGLARAGVLGPRGPRRCSCGRCRGSQDRWRAHSRMDSAERREDQPPRGGVPRQADGPSHGSGRNRRDDSRPRRGRHAGERAPPPAQGHQRVEPARHQAHHRPARARAQADQPGGARARGPLGQLVN